MGLFTWGFEYYFKTAQIEPCQLACGNTESWYKANLSIWERHKPDVILFECLANGAHPPTLLEEDSTSPVMIERFALLYQNSTIQAAHRAGLKIILWNEGDILDIWLHEAAMDMDAFAFEQPTKGKGVSVETVRRIFILSTGSPIRSNIEPETIDVMIQAVRNFQWV